MKKQKDQATPAARGASPGQGIDRNEWIVRAVAAAAMRDKKTSPPTGKTAPDDD
ncbi:MAG: hypothetical protein KJO54_04540 [Gammaproteobacteria bacterium]|nr:hypothetical protein [Gammaproteobacteria bacterium]NNF60997.1 hypothetical protein [Gammaproteobacteria bacterium]NNM21089.1 hypothetical protein [Gammaproteobacteria bacterium]